MAPPASSPARRLIRSAARVVAVLSVLILAMRIGLGFAIPAMLIESPNHGRAVVPATSPGTFSVDVGPPAATLSCRLVPAEGVARGTVVLLHGIRDRSSSLRGLALTYASDGWQAVLVDHRGHGSSSGDHLTYGIVEARDLVQVLEHLGEQLVEPLAVVGFSYGGAVACHLAAIEPRIRGVATIAAFADTKNVVRHYIRRFAPGPGHLVTDGALESIFRDCSDRVGVDLLARTPRQALSLARSRPDAPAVLIAHGTADDRVPPEHGEMLRDAAGEHGRYLAIEGADHLEVMWHERMRSEVRAFLRRLLP